MPPIDCAARKPILIRDATSPVLVARSATVAGHADGISGRLAALVVAGAAHDILAKFRYACGLPAGGGSPGAGRQPGAELMYYGGIIIDLVLVIIVMTQWDQAAGRDPARTAYRPAGRPVPPRLAAISHETRRSSARTRFDAGPSR